MFLKAKQMFKPLMAFRQIEGFTADGTDDVITAELTTNLGTLPLQVFTAEDMGVVTTGNNNRVEIWDATTKEKIGDEQDREVYARLTEAGGVYTLSYYVNIDGVETVYDFTTPLDIDFMYVYQYDFNNLPADFAIKVKTHKVSDDVRAAVNRYQVEQLTVTAINTIDDLLFLPENVNICIMTCNGQELYHGIHFTITGQSITIETLNMAYDIETTDTVYMKYFRV